MVETFIFQVKSSSGNPYQVVFEFTGNLVSVVCGCVAGELGQMCKHKECLIRNDAMMLFDESHSNKLFDVCEKLKTTKIFKAYQEMIDALNDIENRKKLLSKETKQVKAIFARRIKDGI